MKHLKWLLNGVVIFLVLLFLVVGYIAYGLTHPDDEIPDLPKELATNSLLSDLTWSGDAPYFYYLSEAGIYSIDQQKNPTNLVFKNENVRDFFLLQSSRKIYAFAHSEILAMGQHGENPQNIFTLPDKVFGSIAYQVYVAPNEKYIVFFVTDAHNQGARSPQAMFLLSTDTDTVTEFSPKDNFLTEDNPSIHKFYWLKDSSSFIWIQHVLGDDFDRARIIQTVPQTLSSELIKEFTFKRTDQDWQERIKLGEMIPTTNLELAQRNRIDGFMPIIGTAVSSPTGKKEFNIIYKWGVSKLYIDNTEILSWDANKSGYVSPVEFVQWIDDEHLLIKVWDINRREHRILELPSKKVAFLYDGDPSWDIKFVPKWFGQKNYLPRPVEW